MPKFFTNADNGPAKFTGLSTGSWSTDIDLDLDATFVGSAPTIPASATGVILRFVNAVNTTLYAFGARHPDSATNRIGDLYSPIDGGQENSYAGINSNHEVDIYIESTNIDVYLIGYFTAETSFFADGDQLTFTAPSSGSWLTKDLSATISADAVFVLIELSRTSTGHSYSFRHPDSTESRYVSGGRFLHTFAVAPVSEQNIEYISSSTITSFVVVGEITANAVANASSYDVSLSSTGSYQAIDITSFSPPANTVLAVMEISQETTATRKWGVRPYNDTSYTDIYEDLGRSTSKFIFVPVDVDGKFDFKIEATSLDSHLWGYITEDTGGLTIELSDTINLSDSITKNIGLNKADAISLSDEIIKSLGLTQSDSINLSDIISKSILINKSDTINMSDNFNALVALILSLSDTVNLSDSISKEINLFETDEISLSDEIIKSFGLTQSDIINMADNFSTDADVIIALLNFVAKKRNFNFNAKNKTFNFNAKNKTFNFNARPRGES